jgi:Tripartite tricarboxylate transporter family receptor
MRLLFGLNAVTRIVYIFNFSMRSLIRVPASLASLLLAVLAASAHAQDFPNRPGASGVIGGNPAAKAPPDGYTLLITVPIKAK